MPWELPTGNSADWLAAMDYTLADAIVRSDQDWLALVPKIASELAHDDA